MNGNGVQPDDHYRIREARASDADAAGIARVHIQTWRSQYKGIVPDEYLASLSYKQRFNTRSVLLKTPNPGTFTYVAQDPFGWIVGFADAGPARDTIVGYAGEVYALYVLQGFQRLGLGRALLRATAQRLAMGGITSLALWVLAENPARSFYESLGGALIGEKSVVIGGATLAEVAYGWHDTADLRGDSSLL